MGAHEPVVLDAEKAYAEISEKVDALRAMVHELTRNLDPDMNCPAFYQLQVADLALVRAKSCVRVGLMLPDSDLLPITAEVAPIPNA